MKINLNAKKEFELSDSLIKQIKEKLRNMKSPQVYWDYRDELSEEQIGKIIDSPEGLNDVENEIFENNWDNNYELEQEHIVDALGYFETELAEELHIETEELDLKELARELCDEFLDYVSVDMNIKGLISNSRSVNCRVQLYSNYDCINSNHFITTGGGYEYEESYFGAIVDTLNLNPKKVLEAFNARNKHYGYDMLKCSGEFPDVPERNGHEYVDYEKLAIEMENNSCTGLLAIVCKIDLSDVLETGMPTKFIIPKGNDVGIYSDFQGGGSCFGCPLLRDMEVDTTKRGDTEYDRLQLIPDTKEHGYTMKDTYGVTNDFFCNEITFIK